MAEKKTHTQKHLSLLFFSIRFVLDIENVLINIVHMSKFNENNFVFVLSRFVCQCF